VPTMDHRSPSGCQPLQGGVERPHFRAGIRISILMSAHARCRGKEGGFQNEAKLGDDPDREGVTTVVPSVIATR